MTALAHAGEALVEYRVTNRSASTRKGALVLAVRPVQINPYWQHGGHAVIDAIAVNGRRLRVNDRIYVAFSAEPDAVTIADFDGGDVVRLIEKGPQQTARQPPLGLQASSARPASSPFPQARREHRVRRVVADAGRRRAERGHGLQRASRRRRPEMAEETRAATGSRSATRTSATRVEAQTALILVNATRTAFKPGPRNYDRTWIRDGSSQALALLWAGLIEEAKAYVLWYSKRIYENGLVPPILNVDGTINRGYGSDIEFDAQGEFVGIAADIYRVTKDRAFLKAFSSPSSGRPGSSRSSARAPMRDTVRETRFHGLFAPSISHEGYSKPSYSYWDDYFALSAWRNCEYLALEIGDKDVAAHAKAKGREFAANLARSIRMTAEALGKGVIPASADREDVDPSSTSIAFEPCRVEDVLPAELVPATFDLSAARISQVAAPGFAGNFTPYALRNLNAFVSLGRFDDAFRLLAAALACRRPRGWRHWAEVVWSESRSPDYIGDMPHTWIGAEFATAIRRMLLRENGETLELFRAVPDAWWEGDGITLRDLPTSFRRRQSRSATRARSRGDDRSGADGSGAGAHHVPVSGRKAGPRGRQAMRDSRRRDLRAEFQAAGHRFLTRVRRIRALLRALAAWLEFALELFELRLRDRRLLKLPARAGAADAVSDRVYS